MVTVMDEKQQEVGLTKRGSKNRKKLIIIFILAVMLAVVGWKTLGQKAQPVQYQTAQAEKGTLVTSVSASGNISTGNSLSVATTASGVVNKVYVKNGDSVTQGQLIADITLDQNSLQRQTQAWSSYLSAQNNLASANQNKLSLQQSILQDQSGLLTAQATAAPFENFDPTDPNRQKAFNNRRAAEIALQVDQQKLSMADTTISKAQADLTSTWLTYQLTAGQVTAPIAGVIGNLIVAPGVVISQQSSSSSNNTVTSQQLGTVTIPDGKAQIVVNLSEIDAAKVNQGQKATLTLDAFPGKGFTGKVVLVNTNGQVSSGVTNYPATIELDSSSGNIYPNMSVAAKVITNVKNNVILVPAAAVQTTNGQSTIRVLRDGQVETVSVEVGDGNDTQMEIASGINEGDMVITGEDSITKTTGGGTSPFSLFGGGNRGFGSGGGGGGSGGTVRIIR